MLGRQQDILRAASFEPRAHLEGIDLPKGFTLPSLAAVREESQQLAELKITGLGDVLTYYRGSDGVGRPPKPLPEPLCWNTRLPKLFKFSYFTQCGDVPVDLLEDVIFILKMFVRVLTESTEQQLREIGHYLPHQKAEVAGYFMLSNTRYKLITHLMNANIDRPEEALPQLEAAAHEHLQRLRKTGSRDDPVRANPLLYHIYASALTFTNQFNKKTKDMLEAVLKAATQSALSSNQDLTSTTLKTHINLSLVLNQMKVEPNKQKEHTEWAVKWLRKNGKHMRDLDQHVRRRDQPPHPVYLALGAGWFENLVEPGTTLREDERSAKLCRSCGLSEPQVKLFRCSACLHIYYCSKECQKANWKHHKEACKEVAQSKAHAAQLKRTNPKDGQRAADWIKWRDAPHFANTYALAHALGLHRDPSRGRTHIVFRSLEYTPKASKDIRYRFTVAHAGVYKLTDVYPDIETMLRINPGEGKEYVDGLLDELDSMGNDDKVPILDLTFGEGIDPWLGSIAIPVGALRTLPHDPDWRRSINSGGPAQPMSLITGAKDAENIF
ncbi:hypothetical protein EUX98_g3139 [Antrodiella citrinella]|uniref:MYND-type domain-containing protein n=1 Tax=Antrodiella citrinella TaxID=2447956 RepID=A0A4S4MXA2_9APHY|nr:hypothetical protein EUX98_g3139 [Antrodiella citrinella]